MLQRIQTIWLLLASMTILGLFLSPYGEIDDNQGLHKSIKVTGISENLHVDRQIDPVHGQVRPKDRSPIWLPIATIIISLIPIINIAFYKNRKRQIWICYCTILALFAYSYCLVMVAKQFADYYTICYGWPWNIKMLPIAVGCVLPSLAILFLVLAIKALQKDEKLIQSTDRLR